jgi:curved DNA-binding protein CbpA
MALTPRSHYEILGVSPNASSEEIHRAYRRLARRYHPDVNAGTDARAHFDELSGAYEVLHDPERRARYDRSRARPRPRPTPTRRRRDVPRFLDEDLPAPQRPPRLVWWTPRVRVVIRWPPW